MAYYGGDDGGWGGGVNKMKARRRARTRKTEEAVDRRQNNSYVKAVSPRHCVATSVLHNCCLSCCAEQSHKDNVRNIAVEEQLEAKEVQLSEPSSTSLLLISSGLS